MAVEPDPDHLIVTSGGDVRGASTLVYSEEDVERLRLGYCCINCAESQVGHEAPMPERCWVCRYPMRDRQTERFAAEFVGHMRVGPSSTLEEEMAIAQEHVDRQKARKPQILVPGAW